MGKDLFYTILPFLEEALKNHQMVKGFEKIETEDFILYKVIRCEKKDLIIWVCDSYIFTEKDYINKPKGIDFIYIAKPEAHESYDFFLDLLKKEGINIGKFGALMGILHQTNIVDYIPPERRKEEK